MVLAWQKRYLQGERAVYVLRSYQHRKPTQRSYLERNAGTRDNYPISQVGRATSAAPFYFKAVKLEKDNLDLELIDGGFGANNPSMEAYEEVNQMSQSDLRTPVSLGIG